MPRRSPVLERLWQELEEAPATPISELARKYSIPEGAIFEHLRGKGADKVRRDRWDLLLDTIVKWGDIVIRVRNDWAASELPIPSALLCRSSNELRVEQGAARVRIRFSSVQDIYLLEDVPSCPPSVVFCNKRGRCVFEVSLPRTPTALEVFREARRATCTG